MTDPSEMKLAYVFATPLVELRMPAHEQLCETLRAMFLERAGQGDAYRNETQRSTQHGALFESRFDLFRWQEPPVQELATFCHRAVASTVSHLSDYTPQEMAALDFDYHAWFHVTRKGGFQGLHNHENASWSGIFCVDPGDVDAAHPESGLVRFHDARGASNMYMDAGNRRLQPPAQLGAFDVRHEAGKLVIFPSYLLHEIFVYSGDTPRVIVAFNCWVRESGS